MFSLPLQDENGINRPVCSYVKPLRAGRLLDTPRQAARFVNVLGYERAPVIGGGGKQEQWCTLLAFLCRNKVSCTHTRTKNQYIVVTVSWWYICKRINLGKKYILGYFLISCVKIVDSIIKIRLFSIPTLLKQNEKKFLYYCFEIIFSLKLYKQYI